MDQNRQSINWDQGSHFFLNPRWPDIDRQNLIELVKWAIQESNLKSSIWLTTSGTTTTSISKIKFVGISKSAFLASAEAVNKHLGIQSSDCWGSVLPSFHVGGLSIYARAHLNGAKVALFQSKWSPRKFADFCIKDNVTITSLVPTQLFDLISLEIKCPQPLRAVILGGGSCSDLLLNKALELGWTILPSYGMTECSSQIATALPQLATHQEKYNKIVLPHINVRLTQKNGQSLLQLKSPALFSYYAWSEDGRFKLEDPKENGWFTTEDNVLIEESTETRTSLKVLGRANGYFKVGGESTSLSRLNDILEEVLIETIKSHKLYDQELQSIKNFVAISPLYSARLENKVILAIQNGIFSEDFIMDFARTFNRKVLPFEKIRSIYLISEIPVSSLGKALSELLRKSLQNLSPTWTLQENNYIRKEL